MDKLKYRRKYPNRMLCCIIPISCVGLASSAGGPLLSLLPTKAVTSANDVKGQSTNSDMSRTRRDDTDWPRVKAELELDKYH